MKIREKSGFAQIKNGAMRVESSIKKDHFVRFLYKKYFQEKYEVGLTVIEEREVNYGGKVIRGFEDVAIVFQGPVMLKDSFTLCSIQRLRSIYPDIGIIISTWKGEITPNIKKVFDELRCIVIENKPFGDENKGFGEKIGHLNNQILSSRAGINYAAENNFKYVMKIRTDLRIRRVDFIPYLINTMKIFQMGSQRVINVAFSNSIYGIPFHLSDFVWFGKSEDMCKMYAIPLRNEKELEFIRSITADEKAMDRHKSIFADAKAIIPCTIDANHYKYVFDERFLILYHEEIYLVYKYAESIGLEGNSIFECYLNFLKNNVILVDEFDLMIYWNKGLYSKIIKDFSVSCFERLSHSGWMELMLNNQ